MDRLEILSECLIKVENVKQEPDECGREEACNFMEGERTCPLKSEVKEKDEEEELKPSVRLFLDPEEVPEQVPQEHKDPLAMCNENLDKSSWPVGDECDPERLISSVSTHNGPESLNSDNAIHANTRSVSKSVIKLEEIKQEPEDSIVEPVWNSTKLIEDSLKTEVKEEDDEENLCGEDFDVGLERKDRNSESLGADYQEATFSHSKTGLERCGNECDVFNGGNDVTITNTVVEPTDSAELNKNENYFKK
ncbi:Protein of unknown function [Gryllus bimaculatus]|nr:Protein of unknown function [Gryllus bimaculatus]